MVWHEDPDHPFAGIAEKLKRADQNIANLKTEIDAFIDSGKYPVLPHPDEQMWQEAVSYHRDKRIPVRFGVLAGEIVHHLRSTLDHIIWHFSDFPSEEAWRKAENVIEFPVFAEPLTKDDLKRYNRKIQGITNTQVLTWIREMQPYNAGANVADDPLLIVHNMDRFDKHRELVIVDPSAFINIPPTMPELARKLTLYADGKLPASEHVSASRALKEHTKVTPQVSFREFGKRKTQPVIPGLMELFDEINTMVAIFATNA
jgi:hypothetical protein